MQPAFFINEDKELLKRFPEINEDAVLLVDVEVKKIEVINDLYKDGSVFYSVLQK